MDIIAANKISATYIDGGILRLGGQDNIHGTIKLLNAQGEQIGTWGENGVDAQKGYIGGWRIEDGMLKRTTEAYIPPNKKVLDTLSYVIRADAANTLDKNLYDFNGNGQIDMYDFVYVKRVLNGLTEFNKNTCAIAKTSTVTITINPYSTKEMISVYGIDMWGQERKTIMGIQDLRIDKVKTDSVEAGEFKLNKDYENSDTGGINNVMLFGENSKSYIGSQNGTAILGNSEGYELRLQTDGNLVLYNTSGVAVWNSGTARG